MNAKDKERLLRRTVSPHVEPTCGGYAAHEDGEPGSTLIGWWPTEPGAQAALEAKMERKERVRAMREASRLPVGVSLETW